MGMRWALLMLFPVMGLPCITYFHGIGCPHCAQVDPFMFSLPDKNIVLVEYEVYTVSENGSALISAAQEFSVSPGVPLALGRRAYLGDREVKGAEPGEKCLFFGGKPRVWFRDRVAMCQEPEKALEVVTSPDFPDNIEGWEKTGGREIMGKRFEHGARGEGCEVYWNGREIEGSGGKPGPGEEKKKEKSVSLAAVVSLALADSVNPCALAVLTILLLAVTTTHPENKRKVLLSGLSFTLSVYGVYFLYGLVIIRFFQVIQALAGVRLLLYRGLGVAAVLLGLLQIKDFVRYKPGGLMTEMPLSWRPRAKKLLSSATSPKGAAAVGVFVSVFLLPCTIGPYVITGGILSPLDLLETVPYLLLYNAIFVAPMLAITLLIYLGVSRIEDVQGWRERNIRYLHLVAGILLVGLGVALAMGLL